jgi:hypothetical protein
MLKVKLNQGKSSNYYTRVIKTYKMNAENLKEKHKDILGADAVQKVSE